MGIVLDKFSAIREAKKVPLRSKSSIFYLDLDADFDVSPSHQDPLVLFDTFCVRPVDSVIAQYPDDYMIETLASPRGYEMQNVIPRKLDNEDGANGDSVIPPLK